MKQRTINFVKKMEGQGFDGVFLTSKENKFYITNFNDEDGYALVTRYNVYLFVDARYYERCVKECPEVKVVLLERNYFEKFKEIIELEEIKRLGIEGNNMTVSFYNKLIQTLKCKVDSINLSNVRAVKDEMELLYIRKAVSIVDQTYKKVCKYIQPGMTELEVKRFINDTMLSLGADKESFDTMVLSGKKGSMPHGVPSNKKIEVGDFVTMDYGAFYKGYASDITRTIVMGKVKDKRLKDMYDAVLNANLKAIEAAKPGMLAKDLDKVARDYLYERGYGEYFTHSLGHGLGVLIHDELGLHANSDVVLEKNMVFTIEPGVYIPNLGGIRIEDDVVLTDDGCEVLTKSKKKLTIIE